MIVAVDVEGSTERVNPVKAELRRILYELLDQAMEGSGDNPPGTWSGQAAIFPQPAGG